MTHRSAMKCLVVSSLLALTVLPGCGGALKTYPVEGVVVFEDGSPLPGGTVEFRIQDPRHDGGQGGLPRRLNARGLIREGGKFVLGTFTEDDGALAGTHEATVHSPGQVAVKFHKYETSGLSFTVEPMSNEFKITVSRRE